MAAELYPDVQFGGVNVSPSVAGGIENNFATTGVLSELPLQGVQGSVALFTALAESSVGRLYPDFADIWYNSIHIVPGSINAGNLTSQQTRSVEIFNAYFVSQDISVVTATNLSGATLDIVTPETYAPLQSRFHLLVISQTGAPSFDGFFTITFDGLGDFFLFVAGKRVLPIPYQHNWVSPVIERLVYLTTVLPSESGIEQAIMQREFPRRFIDYNFLLANTAQDNLQNARLRAKFQALMFGWMHRTFAVPVWTDATRLQVQANAGQNIIQVSTAFFDYDVGNYLMLWLDEENYELVEIQSMTTNQVVATVNLGRTWPATRTVVMPARLAVVAPKVSGEKHAVDIDVVPITFEFLPEAYSSNRLVAGMRVIYRGIDVLMPSADYSDNVEFEINRAQTRIDFERGRYVIDATNVAAIGGIGHSLVFQNHLQTSDFFAWLNTRKGRLWPVWVPTWSNDFQVVNDIAGGALSMTVQRIDYTSLYLIDGAPAANRRDVMIRLTNGQYFFRRITGASYDGNTEIITIDSALGQLVPVSAIDRVCFLVPSRLEADAVELAWYTGNIMRAAFRLTDLLDDSL